MDNLKKNVINVWGQQGKLWLKQLPEIIQRLAKHWALSEIEVVCNLSYNYVAKVLQKNNTWVVLKISCDKNLIRSELHGLQYFSGHGVVTLIDMRLDENALLLEYADPGISLLEYSRADISSSIDVYAEVIHQIASINIKYQGFPHMREWTQAIDRMTNEYFNSDLINMARRMKNNLIASAQNEYVCHGDLHLENILQHHESWVAIDPKGVVGEKAFEASFFDLIDSHEYRDKANLNDKINNRVKKISTNLDIEFSRLLKWCFIRSMMSAQWYIEDQGDPTQMIQLANAIYQNIDS